MAGGLSDWTDSREGTDRISSLRSDILAHLVSYPTQTVLQPLRGRLDQIYMSQFASELALPHINLVPQIFRFAGPLCCDSDRIQ